MIEDNEKVYDEQISPLMDNIIAICKRHRIPFLCTFEFAEDRFCTTVIPVEGEHPVIQQCAKHLAKRHAGMFAVLTVVSG